MIRFNRHTLIKYSLEIASLVLLSLSFMLVLRHIDISPWKEFIFGNSDILTLSLVWDSITSGEPFNWVFSSQIFLFPELPLYALSSLFSGDFKITLIINAFINIVIFYVIVRLLVNIFTNNKIISLSFGLLFTLSIMFLMAIEYREGGNLAMYYFVTTAYYGVIIAALFSLYLTIKLILMYKSGQLKEQSVKFKVYLTSLLLIAILTGTSNPMFFLQFTGPFMCVLILLCAFKYIPSRIFIWLAGLNIASLIISVIIRKSLLNNFFSPLGDVSSYLHFERISPTLFAFKDISKQMLTGSVKQQIEIIAVTALIITAVTMIVILLKQGFNNRKKSLELKSDQVATFTLVFFCALAPLTTITGTIATGNPLTRYLLPIIFFTPFIFLPAYLRFFKKYSLLQPIYIVYTIALVVVLAVAVMQPSKNVSSLSRYYPSSAQCMDEKLQNTQYKNGVAQYWRARVLQLNSKDNHKIIQTDGAIKRFGWLYNNSTYDKYDVSFVVVDKPLQNTSQEVSNEGAFIINPSTAVYLLGQPTNIYSCNEFDIYAYDPGTNCRKVLNQVIRDKSMGL